MAAATTLFLAGDVMTGRGIDQILAHPSDPTLHEPSVTDAREYVRLAENATGVIARPATPEYMWGAALAEWARVRPAARIVNLETSVTRSDAWDPRKGIHYRMNPDNVDCLKAARIDLCALANNHTLDFGRDGLIETLRTLDQAGIRSAGAGRNLEEATRPVTLPLPDGTRLHVGACAHESSGVLGDWAALPDRPGVNRLPDLSDATATSVAVRVASHKRTGDIVVLSVHWGSNWGDDVPPQHVSFAHRVIEGGVDIVFGHSSHHFRSMEFYRDRLILYGCGDFIDDYEGVSGYEDYRNDLVLMYFPTLGPEGRCLALELIPMKIRHMSLHRASVGDARWMCRRMNAINSAFHARAILEETGALRLVVAR